MMWAMRRKLSGVEKYCWPASCAAPNTSHSRNSALMRPSGWRVTRQPDGRIKAEFRLWDVFGAAQLAGQQYFSTPDNFRRIAHIISDQIYERLTGEMGYFDSRVVFVDETGSKERRIKR